MFSIAHQTLLHWLSPAFPTGAFAYSHGMETAIAQGRVPDASAAGRWISDVLHHGAGWQDAVLLRHGLAEDADLDALDALARALQPSQERLQEGLEQGAALARTISGITGHDLPTRMLPVALAEAARPLGLPYADVLTCHLQGFATNLVTIAIRNVPLGQTEGQHVLAQLLGGIHDLAQRAATASLDDIGGCALGSDMAALQHETQTVRIFRT